MAKAANAFLDSLLAGEVPEPAETPSVVDREIRRIPGAVESPEEEDLLLDINLWVVDQGLPEGEMAYELADSEGEPIAVLDLAWPDGIQEGLSQPVALLIDEGADTEEAANRAGYRFFTDIDDFRAYVRREILALEEIASAAQ